MGLAPKQRNQLHICKQQCPLLWCLSQFHGGPLGVDDGPRERGTGTVRRDFSRFPA